MRSLLVFLALLTSCATTGDKASLYPPRPEVVPGPPIADPPLQRATMHIALTQQGLEQLLSALVPAEGSGGYELLTREFEYKWTRQPFALKFDDARRVASRLLGLLYIHELSPMSELLDNLLQQAIAFHRAGNHVDAQKLYQRILDSDPRHATGRM